MRSTLTQLLSHWDTILDGLVEGEGVDSVYLDFSKAFDKVNFQHLFRKLVERKLPAVILRLILGIYLNQSCFIRWNSVESSCFQVKNGVRQGAILSPSLFCVYLDTFPNSGMQMLAAILVHMGMLMM